MDLVFKRYSSPYFLDLTIENSNLSELIDMLLKKQDEEKLWEMYLATAMVNEKSFEDWKKEILDLNKKKNKPKTMSKQEQREIIDSSQKILSGFKPPQKGGRYA